MRCVATALILTFNATKQISSLGYWIQKCCNKWPEITSKYVRDWTIAKNVLKCGIEEDDRKIRVFVSLFDQDFQLVSIKISIDVWFCFATCRINLTFTLDILVADSKNRKAIICLAIQFEWLATHRFKWMGREWNFPIAFVLVSSFLIKIVTCFMCV